jgi:hypothetical protein
MAAGSSGVKLEKLKDAFSIAKKAMNRPHKNEQVQRATPQSAFPPEVAIATYSGDRVSVFST